MISKQNLAESWPDLAVGKGNLAVSPRNFAVYTCMSAMQGLAGCHELPKSPRITEITKNITEITTKQSAKFQLVTE